MQTDQKEGCDRAELIFKGSIPDGEYNREIEIKATPDGLVIDEFTLVPWECVLRGLASQLQLSTV